jgi:hypothetical protein
MDDRLHLHARPTLGRPEIQQLKLLSAGRDAIERSRDGNCRYRKSDHPFPPWIGGRHAAAVTEGAAKASLSIVRVTATLRGWLQGQHLAEP